MPIEQEIKLQARYAFEEGKTEGAHEKALETAKLMMANNIDLSVVVKCTGLNIDEIKKIQKEA